MAYTLPLLGVLALLIMLYHTTKKKIYNRRLPSQPPSIPLIGNIHQFIAAAKKNTVHLLLERWARQYGEIFRVQLGPIDEYYLNSDLVVKDLIDKNSAITSERPNWIEANDIMTNRWNVLLLNGSDPRWKHQRKVIHSELTSIPRADAGVAFLHYETAKFLHEVANDPESGTDQQNLWAQIGRYTYSTFAMQTLGLEITNAEDPDIDYIHESGLKYIEATLPLSYLVDTFSILQNLPLFLKPWERKGRALFLDNVKWAMGKKKELVNSETKVSNFHETMLHRILVDEKRLGFETDEEAAYLCLMVIQGAADTSKMSTMSFLEAMITFPGVQKIAQEEIDKAVGDRMPEWKDLAGIPYIRCIMKEVWRWRPPVALGHPHLTTGDLEYKGLFIPKGSRLHINSWAIGHDPVRHTDPNIFRPERYIDDTTTSQQSINSSNVAERDHFAFGSGRRVCPGYHVAERSLGVAIMRILWAFDVILAPKARLPLNPTDYPGVMPGNPGASLPACLVVRSPEKKRLIETSWLQHMNIHRNMNYGI